jgi:cytochrome c-type biogenesis protein CcmF
MDVIFIAEWGHLLLWGALSLAILNMLTQLHPNITILKSASLCSVGQLFFLVLSFCCLVLCFFYNDFTVQYVASNSHSQLPWFYKVTAVWGAHEGSLLLWVFILAFWQYLLSRDNYLPKQVLFVSSVIFIFLLSLVLFSSNPFLRWLPDFPTEGVDLNPLLQDPAFVIHPPVLYLGYVGFVIPFVITISTLLRPKDFDLDKYVYLMRKWSLLAFGFLTLGITLGSWWAYYELGWGGWWFWDPVENASFMPWLSGLALIHSLLVLKNRPNAIVWVMILSIVTFGLSILGTFLVRSGIITSVHSFASDAERGLFILGILVLTIGSAFLLLSIRAKHFIYNHDTNLKLNAQAMCIGSSVVLFCLMMVVLLGTTYPILAEIIFSENITIGLPYFNKVTLPFFGLLLLLSAIGPYFPYAKKQYGLMAVSFFTSIILAFILFYNNFYLILGLFLGLWLILHTLLNCIVDYKKQIKKIGMMVAHIGFALSAIGTVVNTQTVIEKEIELSLNQQVQVGEYKFQLVSLGDFVGPNYTAKTAVFSVQDHAQIKTEKRYYTRRQMALSESGILPGFLHDIYISLGEPIGLQTWSVKIMIHPLVRWIWLGAILIALGAFISLIRLVTKK